MEAVSAASADRDSAKVHLFGGRREYVRAGSRRPSVAGDAPEQTHRTSLAAHSVTAAAKPALQIQLVADFPGDGGDAAAVSVNHQIRNLPVQRLTFGHQRFQGRARIALF